MMPTTPQTDQLAQILQQIQQASALQQAQQVPQTQGPIGMPPMGQPQTLGINQPIPMALPQADPQGQMAQQPLDPFAGGM